MQHANLISNIELIIDTIIILLIVGTTIYTSRDKKKKWDKDNDCKIWIDEQKWFVATNDIQENVTKYYNLKKYIKIFIRLTNLVPSLLLVSIFCICRIWFLLYKIITNPENSETLYDLITFVILLLFCFFIFRKVRKRLDNYHNNLFYKIAGLWIILFVCGAIFILLIFCVSFINNLSKLGDWPSSIIYLLSIGAVFLIGFYILIKIFKWFLSKINWNSKPINNEGNEQTSNEITEDELINDEITYDELIKSNKELEQKTGFHQWSLFKDKQNFQN